MKDSLMGGIRD